MRLAFLSRVRHAIRTGSARRQAPSHRIPQLLPDLHDHPTDVFAHDTIARRHGAPSPLAFEPGFVLNDLLDHRDLPHHNWINRKHGVTKL